MPSETNVSLVDLCRVLAGCGVTYAMACRDIDDPQSFLTEWARHLNALGANSDDPATIETMTCMAEMVVEIVARVRAH
jgi:hypothetical protein